MYQIVQIFRNFWESIYSYKHNSYALRIAICTEHMNILKTHQLTYVTFTREVFSLHIQYQVGSKVIITTLLGLVCLPSDE